MSESSPISSLAGLPGPRAWALIAGALLLVAAALALKGRARPAQIPVEQPAPALPTRLPPEELSESESVREAQAVTGYRREVVRPKPVQNLADAVTSKDETPGEAAPGGPASRRRDEKKTLPEIFRMPADGAPAPPSATLAEEEGVREAQPRAPDEFAPFGRLVKCQLVDTIDSVTARSEPIVAIVTQDLDWNGSVIIPAGTEAFSYASPSPVVDVDGVGRLVDNGEWTLVLPGGAGGTNGRELALRARAVDRRETLVADKGGVRSWSLDDGSDGLVGYTLSTLDNRELKLFAAAAISGMAQGLGAIAERQEPAPGVSGVLGVTQVAPTLGNAAVSSLGTGAIDAVNEVAARIRDEISKRGVYVRIPAGKEFYLFVEQTIDPGMAEIGLRLPAKGNGKK
jgi:hypothetical protein